MSSDEIDRADLRKGARFSIVGLFLMYAVVLPLKAANLYPIYLTWLDVVLVPMLLFLQLGSAFFLSLWFGGRWHAPYIVVSLICITAGLVVIWFERGW